MRMWFSSSEKLSSFSFCFALHLSSKRGIKILRRPLAKWRSSACGPPRKVSITRPCPMRAFPRGEGERNQLESSQSGTGTLMSGGVPLKTLRNTPPSFGRCRVGKVARKWQLQLTRRERWNCSLCSSQRICSTITTTSSHKEAMTSSSCVTPAKMSSKRSFRWWECRRNRCMSDAYRKPWWSGEPRKPRRKGLPRKRHLGSRNGRLPHSPAAMRRLLRGRQAESDHTAAQRKALRLLRRREWSS